MSASSSTEMKSAPKKKRIIKSFEQRIDDLKAYEKKHGHVNVKKSDDKSLYQFCLNMRQARKNPEKSTMTLTDNRIASLDALGFDWSVRPREQAAKKSFEQRLEDLRAYKEKHGHVNVKQSDDSSLYVYDFCKNMRHARKNPEKSTVALTDDRIASLNVLGFEWNPDSDRNSTNELAFKQRIEDLKAYEKKHGHVDVKQSDNKSLYCFCNHMRRAHKHPGKSTVALTDNRIASLEALGFDWTLREFAAKKSFEQRIEDLGVYKEKHGHVNVKMSEDKSLYDFCQHTRRARKHPEKSNMTITNNRIAS